MATAEVEPGEIEFRGHEIAWYFTDDRYYSIGGASYACVVFADVYDAMVTTEPDGWTGWDDMFFTYDPGAVEWESNGDACDAAAAAFGVSTMEEYAASQIIGFGYGPMNDPEFEDALSDSVDADEWASEWEGNAHIGWLSESLTGELLLNAFNYGFVYEIDSAWGLVADDEGYLIDVEGSGDASTPVDGYYRTRAFYGYGL